MFNSVVLILIVFEFNSRKVTETSANCLEASVHLLSETSHVHLFACLPFYIDNVYDIVYGAKVVMILLFVLRWWGHLFYKNNTETFTAPEQKRGFYCNY